MEHNFPIELKCSCSDRCSEHCQLQGMICTQVAYAEAYNNKINFVVRGTGIRTSVVLVTGFLFKFQI